MIFYPPQNIATREFNRPTVFLAGSIEMGAAEDWQSVAAEILDEWNWVVFNPRRKDWDSSIEQKFTNPKFSQQVNWELDALDIADCILFYLSPGTISPITLLELGGYAATGKCYVCCPDGFHRKGNVDIYCARHNVPMFYNVNDALNYLFKTAPFKK